jgi:hypothetical protein
MSWVKPISPPSPLSDLRIAIVESFRGLRKLSGGPWLPKTGICSRQACLERSRKDAKNAKFGSLIFFAALSTLIRTCFAPLREIFRVLVAALPRWVLRDLL